jgi:hypothetical protein
MADYIPSFDLADRIGCEIADCQLERMESHERKAAEGIDIVREFDPGNFTPFLRRKRDEHLARAKSIHTARKAIWAVWGKDGSEVNASLWWG